MQRASFKYVDLAQKLMRRIAVAQLRPGDRLPTEDQLVQEHGLSRITVRRALAVLEADGWIDRKRKSGTFLRRSVRESLDLHGVRGTIVVILSPKQESAVDEFGVSENHALATTLQALEQCLGDRGFSMQVMSVGRNEAHDHARLLALAARGDVEAICVHGSGIEPHRELFGSIPIVTACTFVADSMPWVGESTEQLVHICARHLLERGHQRIALICGPWVNSDAFAQFAAGYKRAFDERALRYTRRLLYHAYAGEDFAELTEQILSEHPRPTAILAQDWRVARGVLSAAQRLGIEIPRDLSLLACGQNVQYLASAVPISAYVPDNDRVGQEIARILIDLIDGQPAPTEPVYVPGRIVERASVAAPL